uniref:SESTD1-like spectrin repeats region domain-containing protein n=1 Tax=Timema shepardi TaxID=629360 RepID=A0A7R9ALV9_TIMSH|nr:unnamed protein product [Timema shepardi]
MPCGLPLPYKEDVGFYGGDDPIYISISRITKYVDWSQLPEELGGTWPYNHTQWIQNRIFVESFFKDAEVSLTELERLRQRLSSFKSRVRVSSVEEALTINTAVFQGTTELAHQVLQAGPELMAHLESQHTENHRRFGRSEVATPQDVVDTRARVERLLEIIRGKMELVDEARGEMERCLKDVREINILEDGVSQSGHLESTSEPVAFRRPRSMCQVALELGKEGSTSEPATFRRPRPMQQVALGVTNWILGPAEMLLNRQREVGFDVLSAEELRQEHESLELQCRVSNDLRQEAVLDWIVGDVEIGARISVRGTEGVLLYHAPSIQMQQETYGHYAELLHKIDTIPQVNVSLPEDLKSQRDFMDFVCRSFATRLERRRNVLITSLRFYRLVGEYFEETSVVFESMLKYSPVEDLDTASSTLKDLEEDQGNIDLLEQEVLKEGEKLADILSMPVKDALGRDVQVNYEADILNVHELLNAVCSRRKLFRDSVSLRRLTLEQVCHVAQYERDASQAVQWLRELLEVLLREHGHVGCGVLEIQTQKDDHQSFHETAKSTYEYGCQLLSAALSLRQSCKLPVDVNTSLSQELWQSWKKLQAVCQEQLTRLRVSAVFHRSVQEHCCQLRELMEAVKAMAASDDSTRRRSRLHRFLTARERLLLEVGRMVRLGRLLRTRLREPLCAEHE